MKIDKKLLMTDFNSKSYNEKRSILTSMLGNLSGLSELVDQLGNIIFNLDENNEGGIYSEAYEILLDALISMENEDKQLAIDNIYRLKNILIEAKKIEEDERSSENIEIENMFNDL